MVVPAPTVAKPGESATPETLGAHEYHVDPVDQLFGGDGEREPVRFRCGPSGGAPEPSWCDQSSVGIAAALRACSLVGKLKTTFGSSFFKLKARFSTRCQLRTAKPTEPATADAANAG